LEPTSCEFGCRSFSRKIAPSIIAPKIS
jgi:hypothetical protein